MADVMKNNNNTGDQPMALFAAVSFSAVAILIFNALPVIVGVMSDTLGLTSEQIGTLVSVELGGIGLASVSGLFWIRRVPWRRVILMGTLVLVAGNVLSIFADNPTVLITLRFLTGLLGEGVLFTVAYAALGDEHNTDRAYAFSIFGQVALGMLALWFFPYIAGSAGFAGVMCAMALLALACLALLPWLPVGGEKVEEDGQAAAAHTATTSIVTPVLGLIGMICWFAGLSGIWAFVERIGIEIPMAQTTIGTLLSLGLGLGALAALAVALVGDRYGRYWPLLAAVALHALICGLFAGKLTVFSYGAMVLSFTFIWNIGLPYLLGLIADSDSGGRMVVLMIAAPAVGNTLGPLVASQVVALQGVASVGISSALICVLALATLTIFIYRLKPVLAQKHEAIG